MPKQGVNMVSEQVVSWARQQLDGGYTNDQLKASLQQSGYTHADIREIIKQATGSPAAVATSTAATPTPTAVATPTLETPSLEPTALPDSMASTSQRQAVAAAPGQAMATVTSDVAFVEKASRAELFIRMPFMAIFGIVWLVLLAVANFAKVIQFWMILITGKRNATMHKFIRMHWEYGLRTGAYVEFLTDERPPIGPK